MFILLFYLKYVKQKTHKFIFPLLYELAAACKKYAFIV